MALRKSIRDRFDLIVENGEMQFDGKAKRAIDTLVRMGWIKVEERVDGYKRTIVAKPLAKGTRERQKCVILQKEKISI